MQRKKSFSIFDVSNVYAVADVYARILHIPWFSQIHSNTAIRIDSTNNNDDTLILRNFAIVLECVKIEDPVHGIRFRSRFVVYQVASGEGGQKHAMLGVQPCFSCCSLNDALDTISKVVND
ncbi:MAG: hypothetical protein WCS09_17720 [Pseudomonadota bacterium]